MARHALPLPRKKLAAGGSITGNAGFRRHRVPRRDHRRERINRGGRKIECGHPRGRDAISNDITKALSGSRANGRTSSKCRPLVGAPAIISMASAAKLRVRLLDIGRILRPTLRPYHRAHESRDDDGAESGYRAGHAQTILRRCRSRLVHTAISDELRHPLLQHRQRHRSERQNGIVEAALVKF